MHVKRLTLIGIAAIAAGYTFLSSAGPAVDLPRPKVAADAAVAPCGLAPAHDAPDVTARQARLVQEAGRTGYLRVCQADLDRFDVSAGLKPLPLVLASLDFTPVSLAGTPLAALTSLGGMAEAAGSAQSRLYRSFRLPDGGTLTLFEHDLSVDGGGMWRVPEDDVKENPKGGPEHGSKQEQERVNGLPARLVVLQEDGGKAVSMLSWREGRRAYELWVDANVVRDGSRDRLFTFAAALPASVPARQDDAGAGIVRTAVAGPDGGVRTTGR